MSESRRVISSLICALIAAIVLAGPVAGWCNGYPSLPAQYNGFNPELGAYLSWNADRPSLPYTSVSSADGLVNLELAAQGNVNRLALYSQGKWREALASGCLCEGWGIADLVSQVSGWASWDDGGVSRNLTIEPNSDPAIGLLPSIVINDGSGHDVFRVDQRVHSVMGGIRGGLFQIDVSVENVTSAYQNVVYRRVMDWDIQSTIWGEYVTAQDHPVDVSSSPNPAVTITNDGFASANPLVAPTSLGITGPFDDNKNLGPVDDGALFDFSLGSLAPKTSLSFSVFYGAALSKPSALDDLKRVGVTSYSVATPADDKPGLHTAFSFGFGNFVNHSDPRSTRARGSG